MNAELSLDRTFVDMDDKRVTVNEIIEFMNYENKVSSGIIAEFKKIDPADMCSVWAKVRDINTQDEHWISMNVWKQHVDNKILKA